MSQKAPQTDRPLIPLSFIAEYAYCPRSTYYLLTDAPRVRDENTYIQDGRAAHRVVDKPYTRHRNALRVQSSLRIYSRQYGISGVVDVVEFYPHNVIVPVEFKRGKKRTNPAHRQQLALQALCLREMFSSSHLTYGEIFFTGDRQRKRYTLGDDEQKEAIVLADAVYKRLQKDLLDPHDFPQHRDARCDGCCFRDLCYL